MILLRTDKTLMISACTDKNPHDFGLHIQLACVFYYYWNGFEALLLELLFSAQVCGFETLNVLLLLSWLFWLLRTDKNLTISACTVKTLTISARTYNLLAAFRHSYWKYYLVLKCVFFGSFYAHTTCLCVIFLDTHCGIFI